MGDVAVQPAVRAAIRGLPAASAAVGAACRSAAHDFGQGPGAEDVGPHVVADPEEGGVGHRPPGDGAMERERVDRPTRGVQAAVVAGGDDEGRVRGHRSRDGTAGLDQTARLAGGEHHEAAGDPVAGAGDHDGPIRGRLDGGHARAPLEVDTAIEAGTQLIDEGMVVKSGLGRPRLQGGQVAAAEVDADAPQRGEGGGDGGIEAQAQQRLHPFAVELFGLERGRLGIRAVEQKHAPTLLRQALGTGNSGTSGPHHADVV